MVVLARECLLALVVLRMLLATSAFVSPPPVRSIRPHVLASTTATQEAPAVAAVEQELLDFAIVGGGPAGLAAAVGLKARGLNVKVFEGALRAVGQGTVSLCAGACSIPS